MYVPQSTPAEGTVANLQRVTASGSHPMIPGSFEHRPVSATQAMPVETPLETPSAGTQPMSAGQRLDYELDGGGEASERTVGRDTLFGRLWSAFRG